MERSVNAMGFVWLLFSFVLLAGGALAVQLSNPVFVSFHYAKPTAWIIKPASGSFDLNFDVNVPADQNILSIRAYIGRGLTEWNGVCTPSAVAANTFTLIQCSWTWPPSIVDGNGYDFNIALDLNTGVTDINYVELNQTSAFFSLVPLGTVGIDTTPPDVNINTPVNGAYVNNLGTIEGYTSDNLSGVSVLTLEIYYISGGTTYEWNATTKTWDANVQRQILIQPVGTEWNWDASAVTLTTGQEYNIYVEATDNAWNFNNFLVTVTADLNAPKTYVHPVGYTPGSWSPAAVEVNVVAVDNLSGISTIYYAVLPDGRVCPTVTTDYNDYKTCGGANPCWIEVNVTSDGNWEVCALSTDLAGNVSDVNSQPNILVDTTPPLATVGQPGNGSYLPALAEINGTAVDNTSGVNAVYITIYDVNDANYWTGSGWGTRTLLQADYNAATNTWDYNAAAVAWEAYHTYEINVVATDLAGNKDENTVSFIFDNVPPDVNLVYPREGTTLDVNTNRVNVEWNYYEPLFAGASVDCDGDGTPEYNTANPTDTNYICTYPADGLYTIRVTVVDKAGNQGTSTAKVRVDTYPPVLSVSVPSSATSSATATVEANDAGSGVAYVYIAHVSPTASCPAKGTTAYTKYAENGAVTARISYTISELGDWKVCAYATDVSGNDSNIIESGTVHITAPPAPVTVSVPTISEKPPIDLAVVYGVQTVRLQTPSTSVKVDIEKFRPDLPVASVVVKTRSPVSTVAVFVAKLKGLPSKIPEPPAKKIVEYFSLSVDDKVLPVLSGVTMEFKVPANEQDKQVVLFHYHGGRWTKITPSLVEKTSNYYYFRATVPALSYFAVGTVEQNIVPVQPSKPVEKNVVPVTTQRERNRVQTPAAPVSPPKSTKVAKQNVQTQIYVGVAALVALVAIVVVYFAFRVKQGKK